MAVKTYTINVKANTQGAERGLKGISKSAKLAAGALGGLAIIAGGKAYLNQVNTFQELSNKIKLVTNGSKELGNVTGQLLRISQETRQSFSGTADLYSKLALTTGDLNLNQDKLLLITQNVNKALAVSGSTTQGAEAAMTQLSQAFAGNVLRGEEFNSIMENAPFIIDLLAKQLGVTRSEMRAMAEQGKITGAIMADALGKNLETLNEKFGKTSATVSQANQAFADSFMTAAGAMDESLGISDLYTNVLLGLSRMLIKIAGIFNDDLAEGMQKDLDLTLANTAAKAQLTAKMKDQMEAIRGKARLLKAETDLEKKIIQLSMDHIKREKEFQKLLTGTELNDALGASFDLYHKLYNEAERAALIKEVEFNNSLRLNELDRERGANAIKYQKTLDQIDKMRVNAQQKEIMQKKALAQLNAAQDSVERQRMQEFVDREKTKRDAMRLTREFHLKQMGFTDEQTKKTADNMEAYEKDKTRFYVDQLADQFSAFGAHSKKAFQAYQAFAIAQVIMDTANAAMAAFKSLAWIPGVGPALGAGAAAAAIALGATQISAIRSQSYSGREFGGSVTGGSSFLVGERSPEIFTPQGNGTITPLSKMGGQAVTVNFNIDTTDATGFDTLLATRKNMIVGMVRQAVNEQPGVLSR